MRVSMLNACYVMLTWCHYLSELLSYVIDKWFGNIVLKSCISKNAKLDTLENHLKEWYEKLTLNF